MTSLFNLTDDSSDSENDLDYQPDVMPISDASVSDDSLETSGNEDKSPAKSRLKKSTKNRKQSDTKPHEKVKETSEITELEKQKTDELWKSFLSDVEKTSKNEESDSKEQTLPSVTTSTEKELVEKEPDSSPKKSNADIFEFAGETISVSKDGSITNSVISVETDSQLGTTSSSKTTIPAPAVKRKGLQSVLGTIGNKKQKLNVLQKSLMDWNSYKKEEGIEEDLNKYNKGKGGYIERQRFLQRSDLKSYEVERELKLSKSKFSKI